MIPTVRADQVNICLRAPDEFLSGLLCITFAGIRRCAAGDLETFPEQTGHWYLVGLIGGPGRVTCEKGSFLLEAGQALALSAEHPLDVLFQEDGELWALCLTGTIPSQLLRHSESLGGWIYPQGAAAIQEALNTLAADSGGIAPQEASSAAYRALASLYGTGVMTRKQEHQLPQVVEIALKVLQQDFAFLDGVGELAERLHVSQEYLTRIFRKHVGMTPGKYLNQVRVEHAKLLLQQGDHNVAFVADACGFANGNYFARVFRNMVGVSPSVYARENNGATPLPDSMLDSIYVL